MSYWLTDPELFLYVKGINPDDVQLWRCNKPVNSSSSSSSSSSSLVVPMKSDDFDYVSKVENYVELIEDMFDWDESDYKRLVKYIYQKHLLVNSQGFVIVEVLHEAGNKDGNKKIDDVDECKCQDEEEEEEEEEVPAAIYYIRSLDVLPLKPYIPKLMERPIPLREVKYLGDLNGKAAAMMMEEGDSESQISKLTTRVENLEAENIRLESRNKFLEGQEVLVKNDPVWMNDLTDNDWVGLEGLVFTNTFHDFTIVGPPGTYTTDDNSTNVRARYLYKVTLTNFLGEHKIILPEDLIPYKEMAKFSPRYWLSFKAKGKTCLFRRS